MKNFLTSTRPLFILVSFVTVFMGSVIAQPANCYVISVIDGDSFTAIYQGKIIRCRLARIDAPELKQSFGPNARDTLAAMIAGKTGFITLTNEDKHHRQLVQLSIGNKDVEALMVLKGLAWLYNKDDHLSELETTAQFNNAGLWACKRRIAPWQYRRLSKTAKAMFSRCNDG